ncbi:MAG: hypothetical protein PHU17_01865 [Candidatus Pacebacteria bacterium]|nr:hypothetical protein [Candidatus Paceibacterota bacterium]MDD4074252.1 hypothetical protein [Candidatus Paceibacterota bacterium]
MNKKDRTILFILMSTIFLFVAPSVIMYSQGYRFDIKKFQFVETGGIYIKATPDEVNLYINNEYINKTSFFTKDILIQNLIPNNYDLKIEKEGYFSWEKNLPIEEKTVTEAKHITLFKKDIPFDLISKDIKDVYAYNNKFLLLTNENKLISYDQKEIEDFLSINKTPYNIENITFSHSNERALIKTTTGLYYLLNIKEKTINLIKSISSEAKNVNFNFDEKGIIYQLNGSIYEIKNDYPKLLSREKVDCFTIHNNSIYILRNGEIININGLTEPEEFLYNFNSKDGSNYEMFFVENELFIIENKKNLYHLKDNLFELKIESESELKYNSFSEKIIFYNNNNIWLLPLKRLESPFFTDAYNIIKINSYNEEINNIKWINGDYFLLTINNGLNISEIDNRDNINIFNLDKNDVSNIYFDGRNKSLFILNGSNFIKINKLI